MAADMGWTAVERDVVILAAMPEEHEGYASVLRNLNPRSEPYLTAGLAAQLTCESARDRFAFRQLLEAGAAVRAGVLRLGADAPFFERNVTLAEDLWPVLCGIDVYPASLRPLTLRGTTTGLESWFESPEVGVAMRAIESNEPRVLVLSADADGLAVERAAHELRRNYWSEMILIEESRRVTGVVINAPRALPSVDRPWGDFAPTPRARTAVSCGATLAICTVYAVWEEF